MQEKQAKYASHHAHLTQVIICRFGNGNEGKFRTVLVDFEAEKSFFLAVAQFVQVPTQLIRVNAQCNSDFDCLSYQ